MGKKKSRRETEEVESWDWREGGGADFPGHTYLFLKIWWSGEKNTFTNSQMYTKYNC